jgi:hypothetical protein
MKLLKYFLIIAIILNISSCKTETSKKELTEPYKAALEAYRIEKDDSRRAGYLQLTGLFKLNDTLNTFGKGASSTFQLDLEGLPLTIGTIEKQDGLLFLNASEGVEILTKSDSIITTIPLYLDEYGSSIRLYHNRLNWQVITRSGFHYLRVWDEKNPAIIGFTGFQNFELNPNYIFNGKFTYYEQPKEELVKAQLDGQRSTKFLGKITFEYEGSTHNLEVGSSGFTMVSDETTGDETYGGGRYVYIDLPSKDSIVTLDLNKLYNPPCSFSEFTTCLYPPRQNHLPFKVEAGEKIVLRN